MDTKKGKRTIIFMAPTPPPYMGPSIATSILLNSRFIDACIPGKALASAYRFTLLSVVDSVVWASELLHRKNNIMPINNIL